MTPQEEASRLLEYIRKRRERLRRLRWWFGHMLDNQMLDPAFDDMTIADLVTGKPVWYDDTTVSYKRKRGRLMDPRHTAIGPYVSPDDLVSVAYRHKFRPEDWL